MSDTGVIRNVTIYTDGACCGASSRESLTAIGAGIVMLYEGYRGEFAVPLGFGTSQQAELLAINVALQMLTDRADLSVLVVTDSQYAHGVFTNPSWNPKYNLKIIHKTKRLIRQFEKFEMQWVKGHATTEENRRADYLAAVACGRKTCPEIKLCRPEPYLPAASG